MIQDVPINKFHRLDVCIKCDKGGKLLTCHHNACPMVVHVDCLGCQAQFDDMGNFYCPYCVYKRAIQEFSLAERKAVLAEKVLSKYLDGKGVGTEAFETVNVTKSSDVGNPAELEKDCHQVTGPECVTRDKEADVLLVNKESNVLLNRVGDNGGLNDDINRDKVVEKQNELQGVVHGRGDECCSGGGKVDQQKDVDMDRGCQSGNKIQNDAIQTHTTPKQQHNAGHFEAHKIMKENVEAFEENGGAIDEVQNQKQAHKATETIMSKASAPQVHMETNRKVNDTTASTCMDTNTISEKVTGAQPPRVITPRRSSRKEQTVQIEKISTPCKSSKVAKPPTIFTKLPTLKEKCKRLALKVEEEKLLKVVENQNELKRVVRGSGDECCSGAVKVDQHKDVDMDIRRQSGNKIQNDAIQTDTVPKQHQNAGHFEAHKFMKENVEAVEENEGTLDEVQNHEQEHKTTEKIVCKVSAPQVHMEAKRKAGGTTASTCMDTDTVSEKVTGVQPACVNTPRRLSRQKKSVHIEKSSSPCKSSKVAKPPTIFTKLPTLKEKRKRLAWKVEEEEMLKKAVQKYSKTVNKNLPWQKILEEGRVVFDETRTPADLKDKWRNILSKEPLFELS